MEWTKVTVFTTSAGVEPLTAALTELGVGGFEIEDAADFEEFLAQTSPNWDYVDDEVMKLRGCETRVKLYLPQNEQGAEQWARIQSTLEAMNLQHPAGEFGRLETDRSSLKEEDWANNWKQYFKPFPVGQKLYIKPSWEQASDAGDRKILQIDPSSSFGTGQHHTTRLCLELLEGAVTSGCSVLDLGCGSGILSVGAFLLGAGKLCGVDIDQAAVRTAGDNLAANGAPENCFSLYQGDITRDEGLRGKIGENYDVVAANIVASVLISMAPFFAGFLKPEGTLLCSGIIEDRLEEVVAAVEAGGFVPMETRKSADWAAVVFRKSR